MNLAVSAIANFLYVDLPDSAINNDTRFIFSSGTSWSKRTLIAIIAAAPVATVASF